MVIEIYTSHFFSHKGLKLTVVWERQRQEWRTQRTAILTLNLLTMLCFHTQDPTLYFCFLDSGALPPLGALWTSWLPHHVSETDCISGYLSIYNFIMPTHSSFWLSSASACLYRCILCREIPDWQLCQRSIINISWRYCWMRYVKLLIMLAHSPEWSETQIVRDLLPYNLHKCHELQSS